MNTMYRNKLDDKKDIGGYEQVIEKFKGSGTGILTEEAYKKVKDSNYKRQMDRVINDLKLDDDNIILKEIKEADKGLESCTWDKVVKEKIDGCAVFNLMPKQLLHVHNKVGLSVDELYEVINIINTSSGEDSPADEEDNTNHEKEQDVLIKNNINKIGFVTDCSGDHLKYLMYGKQYAKVKTKIDNSKFVEFNKDLYKDQLMFAKKPIKTEEWKLFTNIFIKMEPLFHIEEFYFEYHKKFFEECLKNNIEYIEMRVGFEELVALENWGHEKLTALRTGFKPEHYFYHRELMLKSSPISPDCGFLGQINEAAKAANYYKNNPNSVKIILTANRNRPQLRENPKFKDNIGKKIDTAIAIKNGIGSKIDKDISNMIIGFDLVSEEKEREGLTNDFSDVIYDKFGDYEIETIEEHRQENEILKKLKGNNRTNLIRYFLHAGESIKDILPKNSNSYAKSYDNAITAPICSRHRIGHGFKMGVWYDSKKAQGNFKCPIPQNADDRQKGNLISDYILYGNAADGDKEQNIIKRNHINNQEIYIRSDAVYEPVLEICPISNYMLGYVDDIGKHPAINLMEAGNFTVICNDDPQIFNNPGLSYDYAVMYHGLTKAFNESEEKAYNLLKLSSFLGFFYKEMSDYYYRQGDGEIWVVNNNLKAGEQTDYNNETEYAIYNRAKKSFIDKWKKYADTLKGQNIAYSVMDCAAFTGNLHTKAQKP